MRKTYLISYDLPNGCPYSDFIERIKQYKTWAHITESTWAIVTDCSIQTVRDELLKTVSTESRLIVIQSANIAAWNNVFCSDTWLEKNI